MDKQKAVHLNNRILHNNKKEQTQTCKSIYESQKYYAKHYRLIVWSPKPLTPQNDILLGKKAIAGVITEDKMC
jgi:hypothetical protein